MMMTMMMMEFDCSVLLSLLTTWRRVLHDRHLEKRKYLKKRTKIQKITIKLREN